MNKKGKTRPVAATTERAEAAAPGGATASCMPDSIIRTKSRQVAAALPVGAENAVDGQTLVTILGYRTLRELSREIQRERAAGHPICAAVAGDCRGYYLAATPDELSSYIRSLDRRIREVRRTREACDATLRRMIGQETVRGW